MLIKCMDCTLTFISTFHLTLSLIVSNLACSLVSFSLYELDAYITNCLEIMIFMLCMTNGQSTMVGTNILQTASHEGVPYNYTLLCVYFVYIFCSVYFFILYYHVGCHSFVCLTSQS